MWRVEVGMAGQSWLQRFILSFVSAKTAAKMEADSRAWKVRCPDGHERSIWEVGGIRYRTYGRPWTRTWMRCPECGRNRWRKIYKPAPEAGGPAAS